MDEHVVFLYVKDRGGVNILVAGQGKNPNTYIHWLSLKEMFDVVGNKWIFDNIQWKYLYPA